MQEDEEDAEDLEDDDLNIEDGENDEKVEDVVADHVANPPGLVLGALAQGRHHLGGGGRWRGGEKEKDGRMGGWEEEEGEEWTTSCSTSSVWRREAMETQASTASSRTESWEVCQE